MTPQRSPIVLVNNATSAGAPSILPVIRFTRWRSATLLALTWKMYELNAPYKGLIKPPLVTRRVYNRIKTPSQSATKWLITQHTSIATAHKTRLKKLEFSFVQRREQNRVRHNLRSSCYAALKTQCWIVSTWAIYVVPHWNILSINFGQINGKEKNIKAEWSAGRGGQEGRITGFADN